MQTRWPVLQEEYSSRPTWQRLSHDEGWQVALQCNEGFPLCFQCGRSLTMAAILQASHWFILILICQSLRLMKWGNTNPHLLMLSDVCTYGVIVRHSVSAWWVSSGDIPYFSMYPFALSRPESMLSFRVAAMLPNVCTTRHCAVTLRTALVRFAGRRWEFFSLWTPQSAVLSLGTTCFDIQKFCLVPTQRIYVFFVWLSEQIATFATYSINWLVFIAEMKSVYSAVRTGDLNIKTFI